MLSRWIFEKSTAAHRGDWLKSAVNSFEIKWKTLWIVGYWNIWKQISVLAENIWMNVVFFDPFPALWIWNSIKKNSLEDLLKTSDFVSLHVPYLPSTKNLIWKKEFDIMKDWSFLINLSRWEIVDTKALKENLESWKVLWAALDTFENEPKSNDEKFISELQWMYNVILTPHIGWSTVEAQDNIWLEVSEKLFNYIVKWDNFTSVNK
jgi:D-3-phosphoglycerate dehydrogenase